ncbi:MAG TPA: hypothetical protein VEX86_24675 [Longimicrobium sp.]|nr:hypothetical protein [Longimicrobium sp.]
MSFKSKFLTATFDEGVIRLSVKPASEGAYPRYQIVEVGTDMFRMEHKSAVQATGHSNYYRIDKVLSIGPA